jgi:predicted DNA-binding helix-hairpin-helix protein
MKYLDQIMVANKEEKKVFKKAPTLAPAGQSTQMVIGASSDTDLHILNQTNFFYKQMHLKRVYLSGYVPISDDARLPAIGTPVPIIRENRLYQADWLLRFYHFQVNEIITPEAPLLDTSIDPKLGWALRNLHEFPININKDDYMLIMRVPGIGIQSAQKIIAARKFGPLSLQHLQKMGIAINRAKYFITTSDYKVKKEYQAHQIKNYILQESSSKYKPNFSPQMALF